MREMGMCACLENLVACAASTHQVQAVHRHIWMQADAGRLVLPMIVQA